MIRKLWPQLLVATAVSLLLGVVIGRQLQPAQPPTEISKELTIYGGNAAATDIEPKLAITLPDDQTLTAELEQLTSLISRLEFCHLPIELVEVENNTATINLAEHEWNQDLDNPVTFPGCSGASWRSTYFQGSAGGAITSNTLLHTLLQPNSQGEWIERITFQYEGIPIEADQWDHIFLSGTITQDSLP